MPPGSGAAFVYTAETREFEAGTNRVLSIISNLIQKFNTLQDSLGSNLAGGALDRFTTSAEQFLKQITLAKQRLAEVERLQEKFASKQGFQATKKSGIVSPETGTPQWLGPRQGEERLAEGFRAAQAELARLEAEYLDFLSIQETLTAEMASNLTTAEQLALGIAKEKLTVAKQTADIISGQNERNLAEAMLGDVTKAKAEIQDLIGAIQAGTVSRLPERTASKIDAGLAALQSQEVVSKRLAELEQKRVTLSGQLAQAIEAEAVGEQQLLKAALARNEEQVRLLQYKRSRNIEKGAVGEGRLAGATALSGADEDIAQLQEYLQVLNELQTELERGRGLEQFKQRLDDNRDALSRVDAEMTALRANTQRNAAEDAKLNQLLIQREQLLDVQNKLNREARQSTQIGVGDIEQIRQQGIRELPKLERALLGAFEGFGRRFEATLQFAISGALIFGVQRLAREFVEAAIEVERAFEDIKTALEFDIEAGRTTAAFAQEVDSVRLKILQLADEFNVLPTEANKAAFVMVSRFGEVDNALKAVRAQLLATKVSGIDQTEVLRALTAVAEGFAGAMFAVNDALSIQDKLLQRERISAELYAEALDLAVYVQQKFGVETEDVLEGTARATEVFKLMGFTMNETAAIVSAVSRQLGQTGVQAAERLVRSIGQLTSPQIRDQLLELAAASSSFFLTRTDFSSGARAWETIADQFARIEQSEPGVAGAILQIIGQRREAEAVAAALGTSAFQQAIIEGADEAAGAAEKRYSFLAATVSERILSIGAAFQELAQNVERLGFLTPLKVLLGFLDGSLAVLNKIIKAVDDVVNRLNSLRIGNWGLGDVLKTIASLALVLRGVVAVTTAGLGVGATLTRSGAAAQQLSGGLAGGGAVALGASLTSLKKKVEEAGGGFGAMRLLVAGAAGGLATAFARLSIAAHRAALSFTTYRGVPVSYASGFGQKLGVVAAKFAPWAIAIGLATAAVVSMKAAAREAAAALKSVSEAEISGSEAARLSAESGGSEAEQQVARYNAQLKELTRTFESGEGVLNGFQADFDQWGASLNRFQFDRTRGPRQNPLGDATGNEFLGRQIGTKALAEQEGLRQRAVDELRIGTTEWWEKLIREATVGFVEGSLKVLNEELVAIPPSLFEGDFELWDQVMRLRRKIGFALAGLAAAEEAGDEDQIAYFEALLIELQRDGAQALEVVDSFWRGVEGTLTTVQNSIADARARLSVGKATETEVRNALVIGLADLKGQLEDLEGLAADDENRIKVQQQIYTTEREIIDLDIAAIRQRMQWNDLIRDEEQKILANLEDLYAIQALEEDPIKLRDVNLEIEQALKALIDLREEIATSGAEFTRLGRALSGASNVNEQRAALDNLEKAYRRAILGLFDNVKNVIDLIKLLSSDALNNLIWELQGVSDQRAGIDLDEGQRLAVATARLAGPINNKMNQINGEIEALRILLDDPNTVEAAHAEARVALAEKLIEKTRETNRIIGSSLLAAVGINDSIGELNAQLSIAAAEMILIGAAFGENTAEYREAARAVDKLEYEIGAAAIELQVLEDRLASDLTDPYEQALIDLGAAFAATQAPGLGDLEQRQADWAYAQAQAAADAALIDKQLFDLKFRFETDQLGVSGYVAALEGMLASIDLGTQAGREAFLEIQGLIDGLTEQADMQFNIPAAIRLPTLFEVRRALAADQLGVNYQDNRVQDFTFNVSNQVDLDTIVDAIQGVANRQISRTAPGSSTLTFGGQF